VAFDPVGGGALESLAAAMGNGGTIFEYGALAPEPTLFPLLPALAKNLVIRGYNSFSVVGNPESLERGKRFVADGLAAGRLKPVIARTFPLEEIAEAHRYLESNQQIGKIVVTT
jgi:NADPH2:quinone reductase